MRRVLMAAVTAALLGWLSLGSVTPLSAGESVPAPPHQFYGMHPEIPVTIHGEPAADGSVVVAYSGAGAVVGDAVVHNGMWKMAIEPVIDIVWFKLEGLVADGEYPVEIGGLTAVPLTVGEPALAEKGEPPPEGGDAPEAETPFTPLFKRYELQPGWNPLVYEGEGIAAAVLSHKLGDATLLRWNADTQAWEVFNPGLPAEINALVEVAQGTALWALSGGQMVVELPLGVDATPWQTLRPGWNLVSWQGIEIQPALAFEGLLERIGGVFLFDSELGAFRTYLPGLPEYLSNLELLPPSLPIWVWVSDGPSLEWNDAEGHDAV